MTLEMERYDNINLKSKSASFATTYLVNFYSVFTTGVVIIRHFKKIYNTYYFQTDIDIKMIAKLIIAKYCE